VIKLLTVIEASTVTGPAKLLLDFCVQARLHTAEHDSLPTVRPSVVTFVRGPDTDRDTTGALAHTSGPYPNEFIAAACQSGIEVDVIPERFQFDRRVITELRRVVEQRAPDIIETQHVKSHFLVRLSRLPHHYPWVAIHHGYTTTNLRMRAYNQLDRWSLRGPSRVITVCNAFARQLARRGVPLEQLRVVHSAIDPAWARAEEHADGGALKRQLGIEPNTHVLLTVGRLSGEKGQVDLVIALDHLRRILPGAVVRLVIIGDGPERQRIVRTAASLGVDQQIVLVGHVTDVRRYYALADLLVLPSHSEGSPNVLLEAMTSRLPVVATAVGGVPEIVHHDDSALLVEPRDPRAMASAISRLLLDKQLAQRLAENAYTIVTNQLSSEARMRSLVEIYRQLLDKQAMTSLEAA
jgi:glycosyltransferase involved in cell wall biosynthesis